MIKKPHYGHTRSGRPVHRNTVDHHPDGTAYQRLNKKIALWMFQNVGTMTAFWITLFLCLCALPAVLYQMHIVNTAIVFTGYGFYLLLTWGISTTFQAVMLPGLMVGQNLQNEAADSRSEKQFDDTEIVVDRLNLETEGGIKVLNDKLDKLLKLLGKETP